MRRDVENAMDNSSVWFLDEKLNAAQRARIRPDDFAIPAARQYPMQDLPHARAALSRLAQALNNHTLTQAQHDTAVARVYARWPQLKPTKDAAPTSAHGWAVGDHCEYVYRFYNGQAGHGFAQGTVAAVHPGTTPNNTTVSIRPAPYFDFGEGVITRHVDGIHHIASLSAKAMSKHP